MNTAPAPSYPAGIIVLMWNQGQETLNCLTSLQAVSHALENTLVVDNNSSDPIEPSLKAIFPMVAHVRTPKNLGFAGGMNAGIRWFQGKGYPYVLLLNNDTRLHPEFLKHLVEAIDENPKIAGVNPKIFTTGHPHPLWFAGGTYSRLTGRTGHRGRGQLDGPRWNTPSSMDFATGCCLLLRVSALEDVGLLDDDYFAQNEDVDLSLRLRQAGYELRYVPKATIWHNVSLTMGGVLSPTSVYYRVRNNLILTRKHNPLPPVWLTQLIIGPLFLALRLIARREWKSLKAAGMGWADFFNPCRWGEGRGLQLMENSTKS